MFFFSYLVVNLFILCGSKVYKKVQSLLIFLVFFEKFFVIWELDSGVVVVEELFFRYL